MLSEDSHSLLPSQLKTLRQFANPLSPQPLQSSLGFVFWYGQGQSYGSEWLSLSEAVLRLMMLLNKKGTPASISADGLCCLTDVYIFMFFFLFCVFFCSLNTFALWAPDVWFSEKIQAGIGFTRVKKRVWKYALSIWPCRSVKFICASREELREHVYILMTC